MIYTFLEFFWNVPINNESRMNDNYFLYLASTVDYQSLGVGQGSEGQIHKDLIKMKL